MNDEQNRILLSEANDRATKALQKMISHETICSERYKGIHEKLSDIKQFQSSMIARMWGAVIIIIMLLLSILGYLLAKGVDYMIVEALRSAIMIATGDLT